MKKQLLHRSIAYICSLIFMAFTLVNCAKRGTPTGGAKDSIPPVFVKADPPNYSTNFSGNEIRIYFDEYIKLKDYQKQLIISPPLKNSFISPQGSAAKYISIDIQDTLQPNTTYVFNFGQSIVDNNEGNPYAYFKYIFSTGDYIDSLTVKGELRDALEREVDNFVTVMLYAADSTYSDSIIYKDPPRYVTNTLDSLTSFEIGNLKEGRYKLVAMKDEDANFTFQPKKDKVAFLESFIDVPKDTSYQLSLFKEEIPLKAGRPKHIADRRINFGYVGNGDSLKVAILSKTPENFRSLITQKEKSDTLSFWYTPKPEIDSLVFAVSGPKYQDTLTTILRTPKSDSLFFRSITGGGLVLNESLEIESSIPLTTLDESLIRIIADSTEVPFTSKIQSRKSKFSLNFETKEATKYKIEILPNALEDFYGNKNDTLTFNTKTKEFADYGDIEFTLVDAQHYPYIIELVDVKGKVIRSIIAPEGNLFKFNTLSPSVYFIRLIEDANGNGIYDAGNFLQQRQSERVIYYPKKIELNAGWLPKETFRLVD